MTDDFRGESVNLTGRKSTLRERRGPTPEAPDYPRPPKEPHNTQSPQATEPLAQETTSMKKIAYVAGAIILAAGYAIWWAITPQTYEQCVQKYLKDARTDRAVMLVYRTCSSQHSKE